MQSHSETNTQHYSTKRPAFRGAVYDRKGFCLKHTSLQIRRPIYIDGKIKRYEKIVRVCPHCAKESDQNKLNKIAPSGYDSVSPPPPPPPPKITHVCEVAKEDDVDSSLEGSVEHSELPLPQVARTDTETPFDSKGRCHQHKEVQLASKRMGAWKVILDSCPKCESENSGTKLSDKPKFSAESGKALTFENTVVHFDSNGCCVNHPTIKIAKKKVLGRWKVVQVCPSCNNNEDHVSVSTKGSRISTRSFVSSRSAKSTQSSRSHGSNRKAKRDANITVVNISGVAIASETQWASIQKGHGKHQHQHHHSFGK
ncbi:hypothetical protein ACHAXS_002752 [Conticribra weissflogii]